MHPETINLLIIGAITAAVLGVAGYFIARWLKGSISITLPGTSFDFGGQVAGSFELLARKEISGNRLFAAVVATETRRERGYNGKSHTHTEEVWRTEQQLEGAKAYPAGHRSRHSFSLQLPPQDFNRSDSMLGQAAQFIFGGSRRLNWSLEVRLDAEGVDLAASKRIYVGGTGGFFSF